MLALNVDIQYPLKTTYDHIMLLFMDWESERNLSKRSLCKYENHLVHVQTKPTSNAESGFSGSVLLLEVLEKPWNFILDFKGA